MLAAVPIIGMAAGGVRAGKQVFNAATKGVLEYIFEPSGFFTGVNSLPFLLNPRKKLFKVEIINYYENHHT